MAEALDRKFEMIWARAAKMLAADAFCISLCGPGPNQITSELVVERGVRQPGRVRELGDGLSDLVLRSRGPLLVRNFEQERGSIPLSWMGAPMVSGDDVLGIVTAQCFRQGAFEERDLAVLGLLAAWATTAVESARECEQRERQSVSALSMLRVMRALVRETDQEGLLRAFAEVVSTVVEGNQCSVWTWAPEIRQFRPLWRRSGESATAERLSGVPVGPEHAPALAEMLRTGNVVVASEGERWEVDSVDGLAPAEARAIALVPLVSEGKMAGLLVVLRCRSGEGFKPREVDTLRELAEVAALATQYQQHHRHASESEALRELNEVKSRLISTISHELRTPLSLVQTGTELLMGSLADAAQVRQVAELVNQGALRLAEVVSDIIEFADLEHNSTAHYRVAVDLITTVREAIAEAAGPTHANRVMLEAVEPIPPIRVDSGKLNSVVSKLVRNAVNFSNDSSTIVVRMSMDTTALLIEVSDTGLGIPPEEMDKVFEPFFRGRVGQSRCVAGTGLGLAIARQLVESMGGSVSLQSQVGHGTTVRVSLPVAA